MPPRQGSPACGSVGGLYLLPRISIIIAVLNRAPTISRCLLSILNQTHNDVELIVMDGGSRDATPDLLQQLSGRIAYWESAPDRGIYHAWNKALRRHTGDWVLFLGADDFLWNPTAIRDMLPHLRAASDGGIRLVYGRIASITGEGAVRQYLGEPWNLRTSILRHAMPPHPGLMHHRDLFLEHGDFDEHYRLAADYEMLLKELTSRPALFVPSVVFAGVQYGGASCSRSNLRQLIIEDLRARRRNGLPLLNRHFIKYYLALIKNSFHY